MERLRRLTAYYLSLLSLQGRLDRLGYWRGVLALIALVAVTMTVGYSAIILAGPFAAVLLAPAVPALLGNASIIVRRLHDRNKSGWWIMPFVVLPLIASGAVSELDPGGTSLLFVVVAFAALILEVWGLVEIGLLSGTSGPNRYGGDPRAPSVEEVFA